MTCRSPSVWGLVAAAGRGVRLGAEEPKQYLSLDGRPMVAHAIDRLAADERVRAVMVVLPPGDRHFDRLGLRGRCAILTTEGAGDRSGSVARGLDRLAAPAGGRGGEDDGKGEDGGGGAAPSDWVLVHDAARPCLHPADLTALIDAGLRHPTGALLAAPVSDTLKRARRDTPAGAASERGPEVAATVSREGMWRALTPQMFRLADLACALAEARSRGVAVTDDAEAMEGWARRRGRPPPRFVEARFENLKVTTRRDLEIAGRHLALERLSASVPCSAPGGPLSPSTNRE